MRLIQSFMKWFKDDWAAKLTPFVVSIAYLILRGCDVSSTMAVFLGLTCYLCMNCNKGLKRITFCLSIASLSICALIGFNVIYFNRDIPSDNLQRFQKQYEVLKQRLDQYLESYNRIIADDTNSKDQSKRLRHLQIEIENCQFGLSLYEEKIKEWENNFWVKLSKPEYISLLGLSGLCGAALGFGGFWFAVWIVNKLIRLFVPDFLNELKLKDEQKQ